MKDPVPALIFRFRPNVDGDVITEGQRGGAAVNGTNAKSVLGVRPDTIVPPKKGLDRVLKRAAPLPRLRIRHRFLEELEPAQPTLRLLAVGLGDGEAQEPRPRGFTGVETQKNGPAAGNGVDTDAVFAFPLTHRETSK